MKDLIAADLGWSGFTVATEVLGLFKSALPSALQDAIDELCPEWRQKHGIVPDISVTGFYGRVRELYELKGLRYSGGPNGLYTDAPPPAAGSPAISAVAARERRISGDVRKKAQKLDERLPPTLRGDSEKGPVERRLDELGTVFGIAFGSFGELSPGLEKLLAEAAKKGGPRVCSDFLVPEGKPAECAAKQRLTRRWGMMAWRVRAAIIEDRMWALGGSRSPKRARHANWERAQCRQSEHFCGRGRGASSAGRSDYYQF